MRISLLSTFSNELNPESIYKYIEEVEGKLKVFLKDKFYSKLVDKISIEIICVHPSYDQFFTVHRPKYIEESCKTMYGVQGLSLNKVLIFNLKIDFNILNNSGKEEGLLIIAQAILETLETLKYPVKLKEFDKLGFYNDMKTFFIEEGLITVHANE